MCRGQPEQPVSWGVPRLHRVAGHSESESPRETRVASSPPRLRNAIVQSCTLSLGSPTQARVHGYGGK